ncbi:MAG: hypothetical protein IJP74_00440 [Prevotella sp.]|nr:hypothetical protein [Prevotella sp.]
MLDHAFTFYFTVAMVLMAVIVASLTIPFYGFMRKRWKGMAIGCLLQPVVCGIAISIGLYFIGTHEEYDYDKMHDEAMVVLRKKGSGNKTHTWYLKADDECLYEYYENNEEERKRYRRHFHEKLFDVIPMDSFRVCVDDVVVVSFDMEDRKVTAVDYDEPVEVVRVDWDRVEGYFSSHSQAKIQADSVPTGNKE